MTEHGGFYLHDLSSTNGIFVNGEKITEDYDLKDGDSIRLGSSTASFIIHSPTAKTVPIVLTHSADDTPREVSSKSV